MRSAKAPAKSAVEHVTKDDIFSDIGFSPAQALELTVKSDLHRALLEHIRSRKMTQAELAGVLDIHQPDVSNLLRGKLGLFSITKLCQYADRLELRVRIQVENAQVENGNRRAAARAATSRKSPQANRSKRIQTRQVDKITNRRVAA